MTVPIKRTQCNSSVIVVSVLTALLAIIHVTAVPYGSRLRFVQGCRVTVRHQQRHLERDCQLGMEKRVVLFKATHNHISC